MSEEKELSFQELVKFFGESCNEQAYCTGYPRAHKKETESNKTRALILRSRARRKKKASKVKVPKTPQTSLPQIVEEKEENEENELKQLNIEKVENKEKEEKEANTYTGILIDHESLEVITSCHKVGIADVFDIFDKLGVVECTVKCMNVHPHNMVSQYNGLLSLRKFALEENKYDTSNRESLLQPFILKSIVTSVRSLLLDAANINDESFVIFAEIVSGLVGDDCDEKRRKLLLDAGVEDALDKIILEYPSQSACILARKKLSPYRNFNPFGTNNDSDSDDVEYNYDGIYSDVDTLIMGKISRKSSFSLSINSISISESLSTLLLMNRTWISVETAFDACKMCYPLQEYYCSKMFLSDDDPAYQMVDYPPHFFSKVLRDDKIHVTTKEAIPIYRLMYFCYEQILNEKWESEESEAWMRWNEDNIIYNLVGIDEFEGLTNLKRNDMDYLSMIGCESLIIIQSKLKKGELKTFRIGIERLATNMTITIELSKKEKQNITITDKGDIYITNDEYVETLVHNHQFIDRDSVITINVKNKSKKCVNVEFVHVKNGKLISQSSQICIKFKKGKKSMKMVGIVRQMDGNGIYYL